MCFRKEEIEIDFYRCTWPGMLRHAKSWLKLRGKTLGYQIVVQNGSKKRFLKEFCPFCLWSTRVKVFLTCIFSAQTLCMANFSFSNYDIKSSKPIKWHDRKISNISQGTSKLSGLESSLEQKIWESVNLWEDL